MPKLPVLLLPLLAACGITPEAADPTSDAPEAARPYSAADNEVHSYHEALQVWRTPEDINAWIRVKFRPLGAG